MTVYNGGFSAAVAGTNQASCACAADSTSQISVTRGGFTYDARSGHFFHQLIVHVFLWRIIVPPT